MKTIICSAKELVLYFMSDGKLLKMSKGWGVEILVQLDLHFRLDHWQQLKEGLHGTDWR